jgi:hypothetical protein
MATTKDNEHVFSDTEAVEYAIDRLERDRVTHNAKWNRDGLRRDLLIVKMNTTAVDVLRRLHGIPATKETK